LVLLFSLISLFFPLFALTFLTIYFCVLLIKGLQCVKKSRVLSFLLLVPGLFVIEHVTYFCGMFYGLTQGKWKKPQEICELLRHEIISK
jgi:hypothetical protein